MEVKELADIRARDAACFTYSDGTIHCGEGGDLVAEDRRALLAEIDRLRKTDKADEFLAALIEGEGDPDYQAFFRTTLTKVRTTEYPACLRADAERQFISDGGTMRTRVHTTIEFTSAVLADEKAFALIVSAQLREGLQEGKNVLVLAPRPFTGVAK